MSKHFILRFPSFRLLAAALFLSMALPYALFAQTSFENGFSVNVRPALPAPYEKVSLSLVSYSVNLDTATITWSVNGKRELSGKGATSFSFTAGKTGEAARVAVTVAPAGGGTVSRSVTVVPGNVDLVWEAVNSYAPPFYRGKTLPSSESSIRVVALPDMRSGSAALKAENLVYRWKRNQKTELSSSGYGRNSLAFKGGFEDDIERVEVTATTEDGTIAADGAVSIGIGAPLVLFYENRPLEGIHYEETLPARFTLGNEEMRVVAEPYFFSSREKSALPFEWWVNGKRIASDEDDKSSVTLRVPPAGSGVAALFLSVIHPSKFMQSGEGTLYLKFADEQ
ncbi:MAG: hypothetical protein Q8Q36_01260 [bacterium]|nr:hypothetical protein [bacterium]